MRPNPTWLVVALALLLPTGSAGTAEAPELADAAGDCDFAPGNEYLDVVAAWISDETVTHFAVNLALAKWAPHDAVAMFSGVTVQFQHQGEQFGVAAFHDGQTWHYNNGYIDLDTGAGSGFTEAEGTFVPGTPAILTIQFAKSNFPHTDMADNRLVNFEAGTADFKPMSPAFFGAPTGAPPLMCDRAEGTLAYEFQVGDHSAHGGADAPPGDGEGAAEGEELSEPTAEGAATPGEGLQQQAAPAGNDMPGFDAALLAVAVLAGLALRRCRR